MSGGDERKAAPARSDDGWPAALVTLLCYGGVLYPAGHGAAPMGLALLWVAGALLGPSAAAGFDASWTSRRMVSGAVIGVVGALVLIAAQMFAGRARLAGTVAGLGLLVASLFVVLPMSDAAGIGFVTATPFGFAAVWLLRETSAPAR